MSVTITPEPDYQLPPAASAPLLVRKLLDSFLSIKNRVKYFSLNNS